MNGEASRERSEAAQPDYSKLTFYEILEVNLSASQEEIKRSYRRLAVLYHPDKKDTGDARKMQYLNQAWCVLRDHESRKRYDAELARKQSNREGVLANLRRRQDEAKRTETENKRAALAEFKSFFLKSNANFKHVGRAENVEFAGIRVHIDEFGRRYLINKLGSKIPIPFQRIEVVEDSLVVGKVGEYDEYCIALNPENNEVSLPYRYINLVGGQIEAMASNSMFYQLNPETFQEMRQVPARANSENKQFRQKVNSLGIKISRDLSGNCYLADQNNGQPLEGADSFKHSNFIKVGKLFVVQGLLGWKWALNSRTGKMSGIFKDVYLDGQGRIIGSVGKTGFILDGDTGERTGYPIFVDN